MTKKISKETWEKIRKEIQNGKSKYQTAADFGIHPTVVYRWTQDLPGGQYGWPGIRGRTLEILQELIQYGYVLGSHFNAGHKYHILRKYFPNICKISMYNKTVLYLDDKASVAARAFLCDMNKKIMSFQELKQVTKTFGIELSSEEKHRIIGKLRKHKLPVIRRKDGGFLSSYSESQMKLDDFNEEEGFPHKSMSVKSQKIQSSNEDSLPTTDDSLIDFYIRKYWQNTDFGCKTHFRVRPVIFLSIRFKYFKFYEILFEGGRMEMKKILGIFICMLLIATAIPVIGQVKDISISKDKDENIPLNNDDKWMKTFGWAEDESGYSVLQTPDGGYIILGSTKSYGAGSRDIWLIKTDNQGNMIWDKTYGGVDLDYGWCIRQTSDGGYIITGKTYSYGNGKTDAWLIKIDSEGNQLWDKTFGYGIFDSGSEVKQTSDGGYIIVGSVNVTGGLRGDIWLIKTDSNGNKLWDKTFGGVGHNYGNCVLLTSDGGYIVSGTAFISHEEGGYNVWLIKTDDSGEVLWDKKYGGTNFDMCSFIQHTNDGGYIITAETESYGAGSIDVWLLKIDSNGNVLWDKTFGGNDIDRGNSVQQTLDDGFIIAGHTTRCKSWDAWLIKTNSNGDKEWIKTYGKSFVFDVDIFFSVQQTPDEGYIITGETESYGAGSSDVWLLKTDSNGNVPRNKVTNSGLFYRFLEQFPILQRVLLYLIK